MRRTLYIIIFFCGLLAAAACSDDDYTTSSSAWLTLSVDTLSFDTVFSGVPSSCKDFWVYNKTKNALRLSAVSQQRGNQSGFRVNVDGIYLGATTGYQTTALSLRAGDSLRCFVELTAATTGSALPQTVEDDILFTLASGNEQRVHLCATTSDARVLTDAVITDDTTYSGEVPIIVYGSLTVDTLATLTLTAGTTLYVNDDAAIEVYGTLQCLGAADNPVVLRGARTDNMFDYLPYDRVSGQWRGVHFHDTSYDNVMTYTDLHSAFTGIEIDSAAVDRDRLVMEGSTVHNCQGYGIVSRSANVTLRNCQISNALADCLCVDGGTIIVNNCTLAQFYPFDAARGVACRFASTTAATALTCTNTLITGYADDELQLGDTLTAIQYHFDDCRIRCLEDETIHPELFVGTIFETAEDSVATGEEHFVEMDTYNLRYDFHLVAESPCVDSANAATAEDYDHDGRQRDDAPDVGAYEFIKEADEDD